MLEAIGDGKIRMNSSSWTEPKIILGDQQIQVAAFGKTLYVGRCSTGPTWIRRR
jgi:hypothetical protein